MACGFEFESCFQHLHQRALVVTVDRVAGPVFDMPVPPVKERARCLALATGLVLALVGGRLGMNFLQLLLEQVVLSALLHEGVAGLVMLSSLAFELFLQVSNLIGTLVALSSEPRLAYGLLFDLLAKPLVLRPEASLRGHEPLDALRLSRGPLVQLLCALLAEAL
jgi:hypothetical protein